MRKNYFQLTLCLLFAILFGTQVFAQVNYSFNFDANSTGWTGSFSRFTGATACGGSGGAMRSNLYSGNTTGNLITPLTGTSLGGITTITYDYKAAVWSANTAAQNPWGSFVVQYSSTATGPWTTFATVSQETQTGSCLAKSHTFAPPAGALYIRFSATWTAGDYYLNFDNINISEAPLPPAPTQAGGTPTCSAGSVLSVTGTPAANETWYWQTAANGTSTANDAASPLTVFANGTYYVRSFNSLYSVWSGPSSVVVSNFPVAANPPAATGTTPACNSTTLTAAAPPVGTEYYWQTMLNGTSNANNASTPLNVTTTGTYYLSAFETASGCWSNTTSTAVTIDTYIPAAPTANPAVFNYCGSAATMPISATAYGTAATCAATNSANGPDVSTTVTVSNFACATGPISSATLDASIGGFCGTWYNYDIVVNGNVVATAQCNQTGFNLTPYLPLTSVQLVSHDLDAWSDNITLTATVNLSYSNLAPAQWFNAPTAGTQIGTGSPFEALGSSVIPVAANGAYQFYAASQVGACFSATRTLVTVNIADVDVVLTPIDETCTGYSNGSFAHGTTNCGVAPFTYSVDGGAFGAIPTNLTAGTYDIVVKDAGGNNSGTYTITIATTSSFIPADPAANPNVYNYCTSAATMPITAIGYGTTGTCAASNSASGPDVSTTVTVSNFACATGPISSATLDATIGTFCGSWYEYDIVVNGNVVATGQCNQTGFDLTPYLPLTSVQLVSHDLDAWTDNVTLNATVNLSYANLAPAEWFNAPTAGSSVGTGNTINGLGTSVLPTAVNGSYQFYAASKVGGCYSANRTLVTLNVNSVNQELTAFDASCNNGNDGTFAIANPLCGVAPFTYSIDGGTFVFPIPMDLTAGSHTVVVKDANGDLSATYTISIGSAAGPDAQVVNGFDYDTVQISWNANGSETSWNIEWGPVGFTPGTGTQTGSATAGDTVYTITGLDGDTEYDIYISADCGAPNTPGDWAMTNVHTECDPIVTLPWCEDFESTSSYLQCWSNLDNDADGYTQNGYDYSQWTNWTNTDLGDPYFAHSGEAVASYFTQNNGTADDYLILPRMTLTGNEVMTFNYRLINAGAVSFKVLLSTTGKEAADFTEVLLADDVYTNDAEWKDTSVVINYSGEVFIAFVREEVGPMTYTGLAIDDVCVDVCIPIPGTDGTEDFCRLDGSVDLDPVISTQYPSGEWIFPANQSIINGSMINLTTVAEGTYDILFIKATACTSDTTVATITVFGPSSAGDDGTLDVCRNEPVDLLHGLSGSIDLGGTWYNPSQAPLANSAIVANNVPGQYNYTYITGNGVCPDDTSSIILNVSSTCNYLNVEEMVFAEMSVYPNPSNGIFNIANESSSVFSYEVLDVEGRLVERKEAAVGATSVTSIDMTGKVTGIYMIRVYNGEADKVFRVVLQ